MTAAPVNRIWAPDKCGRCIHYEINEWGVGFCRNADRATVRGKLRDYDTSSALFMSRWGWCLNFADRFSPDQYRLI